MRGFSSTGKRPPEEPWSLWEGGGGAGGEQPQKKPHRARGEGGEGRPQKTQGRAITNTVFPETHSVRAARRGRQVCGRDNTFPCTT